MADERPMTWKSTLLAAIGFFIVMIGIGIIVFWDDSPVEIWPERRDELRNEIICAPDEVFIDESDGDAAFYYCVDESGERRNVGFQYALLSFGSAIPFIALGTYIGVRSGHVIVTRHDV